MLDSLRRCGLRLVLLGVGLGTAAGCGVSLPDSADATSGSNESTTSADPGGDGAAGASTLTGPAQAIPLDGVRPVPATVMGAGDAQSDAVEEPLTNLRDFDHQNGPAVGLANVPHGVFYLDLHDRTQLLNTLLKGSLFRELSRQAVLLAAREELGLATRDRTLREAFPWSDQPDTWPLSVITSVSLEHVTLVSVIRHSPSGVEILWEERFQLDPAAPYESMTAVMERLSREDFVQVLNDAGHTSAERPEAGDAGAAQPSEQAISLLTELNSVAQYAAVRRLHAEIKQNGESGPRLGALARGYANLGVLTDAYCSAMHKGFLARALLYAERAVVLTEGDADAYRDRAYVRALLGLPEAARLDLVQADTISSADSVPEWIAPVRAYCQGQVSDLRELEDSSSGALASFLSWKGQQHRTDDIAEYAALGRVLEQEPDCMRMMYQVAAIRSLGTKATAVSTFDWLPQMVQRQAPKVEGLPDGVRAQLAEGLETGPEFTRFVRTLKEHGDGARDQAEPSLDVLGQLLNESAFLTAWRVLDYYQHWLSVPIDQHIPELVAWIEGHPHASALPVRGQRGTSWQMGGQAVLNGMRRVELEFPDAMLIHEFLNADRRRGVENDRVLVEHSDTIVPEICFHLGGNFTRRTTLRRLQDLKRVAPALPATLEWRISLEPDTLSGDFEELEEAYAEDVSIQELLSKSYSAAGDIAGADRCARRWTEARPSYEAFEHLASIAELRGDEAGWLEALELALEQPVPGLEHAQTRSRIARRYLSKDQPARALPYAEDAAQTGAAWAMLCAADVHDALENWDESNSYRRVTAQRYPDQTVTWYFWCLRTGQGDLDIAEQAARRYLASLGQLSTENEMRLAIIEVLGGQTDAAYERTLRIARSVSEPFYCWFAFVLADLRGQADVRVEMLQRVVEISGSGERIIVAGTAPIAEYVQQWLASGAGAPLDVVVLDREIARLQGDAPTNMWFFLSQVLHTHGQESDSLEYLRRAALSPAPDLWSQELAAHLLRSDGQSLRPARDEQFIPLASPFNEANGRVLSLDRSGWQVRFLQHSSDVVVTEADGSISLWSPESGERNAWLAAEGLISDIAPDDQFATVLPLSMDRVEIWEPGAEQPEQVLPGIGVRVYSARFVPDDPDRILRTDTLVDSDTVPGTVLSAWNVTDATEVWRTPLGDRIVQGIDVGPSDGLTVLAGRADSETGWIGLFNNSDGSEIQSVEVPRHPVARLVLTGDRAKVATLSTYGEVILWDLASLEPQFRLWSAGATELALAPDASLLAVSAGGVIRLFDPRTDRMAAQISDHVQPVYNLRFSTDGTRLASAAGDMTARVWDVGEVRGHRIEAEAAAAPILVTENSIGVALLPVPAGEFMMGERDGFQSTPNYQRGAAERGRPRHRVVLTRPFYLSQHEVTVGQFREFITATGYQTEAERKANGGTHIPPPQGEFRESREWKWTNPGYEQDDSHPVVMMSWNDACRFCEWLSATEGHRYRLPTEAEWEYACRAGTLSSWYSGNYLNSVEGYGNTADHMIAELYDFYGVASDRDDGWAYSAPVGSYLPNPWGFFDMHGNVWEWTHDFFLANYYQSSPERDPMGPERGTHHTQRGGSFFNHSDDSRSAHRDYGKPDETQSGVGFRLLREIGDVQN